MEENEIKELLQIYMEEEMKRIPSMDTAAGQHEFSPRFRRRIRKLMWSEKYFGRKIYTGYLVRRAAVVIIVILSILTVTEVSARIFGFHPWKYIADFDEEAKMDQRDYLAPDKKVYSANDLRKVTREFPGYVPQGFVLGKDEADNYGIFLEWHDAEGASISYHRLEISSSMSILTDGEYDQKETISIAGYEGDYCVKGKQSWVQWDDVTYFHRMDAANMESTAEELIRMAESLYEK